MPNLVETDSTRLLDVSAGLAMTTTRIVAVLVSN
jgi:hypothetical protein